MTNDVLLVFLTNTHKQTKLSLALGETKAIEIHEQLQAITKSVVETISDKKIIIYLPKNYQQKIWNNAEFRIELTEGEMLNEQIKYAFSKHLIQDKTDVNKVVFITADCPKLTTTIINDAFESLNKYDVCIGPEKKGGYYLIGMKEPLDFLFEDKLWNTHQLLDESIEGLIEQGKKYFLLTELQSVNDIYDLHLLK